jgi:hypothetical protein
LSVLACWCGTLNVFDTFSTVTVGARTADSEGVVTGSDREPADTCTRLATRG